jgi:DNA-binding CsgD family transcriptional regulator
VSRTRDQALIGPGTNEVVAHRNVLDVIGTANQSDHPVIRHYRDRRRVTWDKPHSRHGGYAFIMATNAITPRGFSPDEFPGFPVIGNERFPASCMTKVTDAPPAAADREQLALLSICEREVLKLLGTGCSLRTIARHLALSDGTVKSHVHELLRKLRLASTDALRERALALGGLPDSRTAWSTSARPQHLPHQSRWLPNVPLSTTAPLGSACRRVFNGRTLRDVADYLRDCRDEPGPFPDEPAAILRHHTGTLGAKHGLLAALAIECGRQDVQLIVACHELEVSSGAAPDDRRVTLPLAVCYLRCGTRDIQIAAPGAGSVLTDKALSSVCIEPQHLARMRLRLYQHFALDWCRALDLSPVDFARLRAARLRTAERGSVFEDLLGHRLPPSYIPAP